MNRWWMTAVGIPVHVFNGRGRARPGQRSDREGSWASASPFGDLRREAGQFSLKALAESKASAYLALTRRICMCLGRPLAALAVSVMGFANEYSVITTDGVVYVFDTSHGTAADGWAGPPVHDPPRAPDQLPHYHPTSGGERTGDHVLYGDKK